MRSKNRATALLLAAIPRAPSSRTSSASVMSALAATRERSHSPCASSGERRPPRCGLGPRKPSARYACIHFTAVEALTSNTFAWDRADLPFSTARISRTRKSPEYAIATSRAAEARRFAHIR